MTILKTDKIHKYGKSSLAVLLGAAVAITAFVSPAGGADSEPDSLVYAADEPVSLLTRISEASEDLVEPLAAFFDAEPAAEAAVEFQAAANPIALPAPAYVTPADRIPVNFPSPTGFETVSNVGRSMSPTGIALLKELEGLELTGYVLGDGMCTIGYGHAEPLSVVSAADCRNWTITEDEAEAMLRADVQIYADAVGNHFTRPLTQNQFDALTSFTYNVGTSWFEKWDWHGEPDDHSITGAMIMAVYPAKFKEGLTARRNAEIALFYLDSETA